MGSEFSPGAATGGQAAANQWIGDVDMYLEKLSSVD